MSYCILRRMKTLKTYLRRNRIGQSEFARRLSVSQPTVWAWINGTKMPKADNLVRISRETGISVDALLGRRAA